MSATAVGETAAEAIFRHDLERDERLAQPPAVGAADRGTIAASAAGRDGVAATVGRALLELVERRACLLWWAGDLQPSAPSAEARAAFEDGQRRWPRVEPRRTGLLQLGLAGLPPVLVAWSCDARGRSACFGMGCSVGPEDAARHALKELYQMEFGLDVIRHRARHGMTLSPFERRMLDRAETLGAGDLGKRLAPSVETRGAAAGPRDLRAGLLANGIDPEITVTEGSCTVVRVRFRPPMPQAAAPGGWPLYGTLDG